MGAALLTNFDTNLSAEDRLLLDRHLPAYLKLLDRRAEATTEARKHFLKVAHSEAVPLTPHEAAFVRWQLMVGWREAPKSETGRSLLQEKLASASAIWNRSASSTAANIANWTNMPLNKAVGSVAIWYNALLATDTSTQLDRWMRDAFSGDSSIYDRAMDAIYASSNVGGQYHRIFDGSHDLAGAWSAVSSASSTDVFTQEVAGYLSALWKDVVTPMGLPIATIDRASFAQFATQSEELLGVSSGWLADAATVTATELGGVILGALSVCLGWSKAEVEEVAKLAGSLILSTAVAANPFLLVVALVCLARAYQLARHGSDLAGLLSGVAQGGSGTAAFIIAAAFVSGPVWVTVLAGVIACVVTLKLSKGAADELAQTDWSKVSKMVLDRFRQPSEKPSQPALMLLAAPAA